MFVCTGNTCRSPMAEGLRLAIGVDDSLGRTVERYRRTADQMDRLAVEALSNCLGVK
jgi:protein-tyrosine-phosphatase